MRTITYYDSERVTKIELSLNKDDNSLHIEMYENENFLSFMDIEKEDINCLIEDLKDVLNQINNG
jgi:hypothetical protein